MYARNCKGNTWFENFALNSSREFHRPIFTDADVSLNRITVRYSIVDSFIFEVAGHPGTPARIVFNGIRRESDRYSPRKRCSELNNSTSNFDETGVELEPRGYMRDLCYLWIIGRILLPSISINYIRLIIILLRYFQFWPKMKSFPIVRVCI